MAKKARFTADEEAGYALFRSNSTHCNECHRDGGPGEEPLFTDFTASNLGLPTNPAIPSDLDQPDPGVGGFLESPPDPDGQWAPRAKSFIGKFKTPTLRNVDKRPGPDFVKAYMH